MIGGSHNNLVGKIKQSGTVISNISGKWTEVMWYTDIDKVWPRRAAGSASARAASRSHGGSAGGLEGRWGATEGGEGGALRHVHGNKSAHPDHPARAGAGRVRVATVRATPAVAMTFLERRV